MKNYGKLTAALLAAWFVFALSASAAHLFRNDENRFGIQVALAAVSPILIFAVWFAASKEFRQFTLSLNPSILTLAQSWRLIGFTFVLLQAHGALPAMFALPAGYGDMFIGATATYVALKLADPAHCTRLHNLASAGHHRPGVRGRLRHDRPPAGPGLVDGSHDRAAFKPGSDISGAAISDLSRDLDCTGKEVEDGSGSCLRLRSSERC